MKDKDLTLVIIVHLIKMDGANLTDFIGIYTQLVGLEAEIFILDDIMKKVNQLKEAVVKATIVLSQRHQAGWNLFQVSKEADANLFTTYSIIKHLIGLGYITKLSNNKYIYQKKVNMSQLNQIVKMIVTHWDICVYSTFAANRYIPRTITAFTTEELIDELKRRQ